MQDATLLLGDDSDEAPESPGMARAATPLGERAERRAVLREALGDISNAVSYTHLTLPTICSV